MKHSPIRKAYASMGSGLETPVGYFPVRNLYRAGSLVAFFFLLGCSAVVFLEGLSVAYQAYQKHGLVMIEDSLTVPGLIAIILFGGGLAAGWWAFLNWKKGVAVYKHGFAVHNRKGRQLWHWEDIVSLTAAVSVPFSTHAYTLINRKKQRLVLDHGIFKVEELVVLIQQATTPILYDQARKQYNAGQRLVFGPVKISKAGMEVGRKTFVWEEVRQVSIRSGILRITKKEAGVLSGARTSVSGIPNLQVLLNIIHQVVGLKIG